MLPKLFLIFFLEKKGMFTMDDDKSKNNKTANYTAEDALETLLNYIKSSDATEVGEKIQNVPNTGNRGLIISLNKTKKKQNEEKCVIFVYPISCKQNKSKRFFDTRDSGPNSRLEAWQYAHDNSLKYFCLGVNDREESFKDYVFSLECSEDIVEETSGRRNGRNRQGGSQVVIPKECNPKAEGTKFQRIHTKKGFWISIIHKSKLKEYLKIFDNRPYEKTFSDKYDTGTEFKADYSFNQIIFGAPGTGKSYSLENAKRNLLGENEKNFERVTFYPDYTYYQFVGSYKPVSKANEIRYEFVPGPFMRLLVKAIKNGKTKNPQPFVLIIEEINRGQAAKVFGDIFQLLDRKKNGVSQYEIQVSEDVRNFLAKKLGGKPDKYETIKIPNNMYIWATMNSADQGVFPMDTAFKRRWDFEYIGIDKNEEEIENKYVKIDNKRYKWNSVRKAINNWLTKNGVNEDKLLGPFFISKDIIGSKQSDEIDEKKFCHTFKDKVLMYLFEDAARQLRKKLFNEKCGNRFSDICDQFDKNGFEVFNDEIVYCLNNEDCK